MRLNMLWLSCYLYYELLAAGNDCISCSEAGFAPHSLVMCQLLPRCVLQHGLHLLQDNPIKEAGSTEYATSIVRMQYSQRKSETVFKLHTRLIPSFPNA